MRMHQEISGRQRQITPRPDVVIVNPHLGNILGGAEVNDINLGRALRELGCCVRHITVAATGAAALPEDVVRHTTFVDMPYWYNDALGQSGLRGKWSRHRFEKEFAENTAERCADELRGAKLVLLSGRAVLGRLRSVVLGQMVQSVRGVPNAWYRRLLKSMDGLIYWGGCEVGQLVPDSGPQPLFLNAASEPEFFYPGDPDRVLREELTLGGRYPCVVVSTSRLNPIQRIDGVLRAFAQSAHELPLARLVLVGDGQEEVSLKKLAAQLLPEERFCFKGRVDRAHLGDILRASDVFVMNPRLTSYSLCLQEALLCEMVVVAPLTGTVANSVSNSRDAFVFTPCDEQGLKQQLVRGVRHWSATKKPRFTDVAHSLSTWGENAEAICKAYLRMES